MPKEEIIEKIQLYINNEESLINDQIRPNKPEKKSVGEIDLDAIFGGGESEENNIKDSDLSNNYSKEEFNFWKEQKDNLRAIVDKNLISNEDFWILKDAMNIIRGKYYMNDTYETVDKDFQDMCSLFISLQLKKNDIGINNFLRYFNPDSAYYKRVKALTMFRLLDDPQEQIETVRDDICGLLYDSTQYKDGDYKKSENILKEYIERVFNITRTSYESRIEFISEGGSNWDTWCGNDGFVDWLWKYVNGEKLDSEVVIINEEIHENEEIESLKTKLKEKEDEAEQIKREQEAILQRQKELEEKLSETQALYNENLKKKEIENAELQAKILLLQQANEIANQIETKKEIIEVSEDLE